MIPIEDTINQYLNGLGATLWGRSFNINDDRDEAVQFIAKLWRDLEHAEVEVIAKTDLSMLIELVGG
jgi:hypothetical protein